MASHPQIELALVGIAAGDPGHLTPEARAALAEADVILIPQKADERAELAALRHQLLDGITGPGARRRLDFEMPERDPAIAEYRRRVVVWHQQIAEAWAQTLAQAPEARRVALLVWGDPALFDSTLRIAEHLRARQPLTLRVVPGLTAIQLLTAAHGVPLNALAEPFLVTTGRHLRSHGWPGGVDTLVVMLDGDCAFATLDPTGVEIWWGAYLGMAGQILEAGPLAEAGPRIQARRAAARAARGWIMDTYLLRRASAP